MSVRLVPRRTRRPRRPKRPLRILLTATALLITSGHPASALPFSAPKAEPDPVIFVHGLFGGPDDFDAMADNFAGAGYGSGTLFSFGYRSTGSLTTAAEELAAEVDRVLARTGADEVDIVTHSLGGLPSRWYVRFLGGTATVDDWVSLGGPNNGGAPGSCPAPGSVACEQATAGSEFITRLNEGDPTPGPVGYSTFYSPCDTVVENEWTKLDGATNNDVGCVSHVDLLDDGDVFNGVLAAVTD